MVEIAGGRKKQAPVKCTAGQLRAAVALFLLALAAVPFYAIRHLDAAHGSPSRPVSQQQGTVGGGGGGLRAKTSEASIRPVSCKRYLSDSTIYDPNTDPALDKPKREDTKRLTITEPKFYISLHSQFL